MRENEQVNVLEEEVKAIFIPLQCASCSTIQLAECVAQPDPESGKRPTRRNGIPYRVNADCEECRSQLAASLTLVEYPAGVLSMRDLGASKGARLAQVGGFRAFLRTLRQAGCFTRALQDELGNVRGLLADLETQAPSLAKSLRGVSQSMSRSVAVFGSYKANHKTRLREIQRVLLDMGREAIITDEMKPAPGDFARDISRRVAAVTNLVILYDKEPSGANNEIEMIVDLERPLAILRENGHRGSSQMLTGLAEKHTYVRVFEVGPSLEKTLANVLRWAEQLVVKWAEAPGSLSR